LPVETSYFGKSTIKVDNQEQCKLAELLKWLTLPMLASAILISCAPVTSHG